MDCLMSYDIRSNKRRNKISKILKDYGQRVQFSVFEISGLKAKVIDSCITEVTEVLNEDEGDSFRVYMFCEKCSGKIKVFGKGSAMDEPDHIIII